MPVEAYIKALGKVLQFLVNSKSSIRLIITAFFVLSTHCYFWQKWASDLQKRNRVKFMEEPVSASGSGG